MVEGLCFILLAIMCW